MARSQPLHHVHERVSVASGLPPVVPRLVMTMGARRIAPAQPIAGDEDDAAQHPPVIHPRLAVALGKVGKNGRGRSICSSVRQKKVAHPGSLAETESDRDAYINGS